MWERLLAELRRVGLRKLLIIAAVAAIAVVLAYGNNSTNDAASGRTLPRMAVTMTPTAPAVARHP